MIALSVFDMGSPLMQILGVIIAAAFGCAAGLMVGSALGRTSSETPLPGTIRLSRERLASSSTRLEKASTKLSAERHSEIAGNALILAKRVTELSTELGRIERKSKRSAEVDA